MIVENDFNEKQSSLNNTKSSKIASQIDQLHQDHRHRRTNTQAFASLNQQKLTDTLAQEKSGPLGAGAKFTNTIL